MKYIGLLVLALLLTAETNIPNRESVRIARGKVTADGSGLAEIKLQIPSAGRFVKGGVAWFDNCHADDHVLIDLVDGSDNIIGTFTDSDMVSESQGWYIPKPTCILEVDSLNSAQKIPGGQYLRIKAQKGDNSQDTLRFNIKWGI